MSFTLPMGRGGYSKGLKEQGSWMEGLQGGRRRRELGRPWRCRRLGRPWWIRRFGRPWQICL